MTYESAPRYRDLDMTDPVGVRDDDSRFRGEPGFREEQDFRSGPAYRPGGYPADDYTRPDPVDDLPRAGRRGGAAALDDVFDDPEHGDPGRDRLTVHLVWELLLLVAAATLGVLLYRDEPDMLRADRLDSLLVFTAALGLLALGAGLTLRAGAPNLAIGPAAVVAAIYFSHEGDRGVVPTAGLAVAAAAAAGLVLAVLVVGFHVPSWAASLAAALGGIVWIQQVDGVVRVAGDFDPRDQALPLFGGFAVLAVLGGLLGTAKVVRRAVGRFRPVADPARRRGALAAVLTGLALIVSMAFAAVAGVLLAARGDSVTPTPGLELTGLALGAALLGGTSAFGRRGGIFGTLLAVVLISLFIWYDDARGWDISLLAVAAAAIGGGMLVTRLVETYGRPVPVYRPGPAGGPVDNDGWVTTTPGGVPDRQSSAPLSGPPLSGPPLSTGGTGSPSSPAAPRSWSSSQDPWSTAVPGQSPTSPGEGWGDDRWTPPPR